MTLAIRWVADRYPPSNDRIDAPTSKEAGDITVRWPMVINLPIGMRKIFYDRIAANCGPLVMPMSPEALQSGEPIYHVGRVWVRAHESKVDVYRPVPEIGAGADGKLVYQMITVTLEGGFEPWRVVAGRAWEPGAHPVPETYFVPDIDRQDQYYEEMRNRRDAREAQFVGENAEAPMESGPSESEFDGN